MCWCSGRSWEKGVIPHSWTQQEWTVLLQLNNVLFPNFCLQVSGFFQSSLNTGTYWYQVSFFSSSFNVWVLFSRLKFVVKLYPFQVPHECSTDVFAVHFQTAVFPFFSLFSLIYRISREGFQLEYLAVFSTAKVFWSCMERQAFTSGTCYYRRFYGFNRLLSLGASGICVLCVHKDSADSISFGRTVSPQWHAWHI